MEAIETRKIMGVIGEKKVSWGNYKNNVASFGEYVILWNNQKTLIQFMKDFIKILDKGEPVKKKPKTP